MADNNTLPMDQDSNRRVRAIVHRAQQELGVMDVATFAFSRAWSIVRIAGAAFCVAFNQWNIESAGGDQSEPSTDA